MEEVEKIKIKILKLLNLACDQRHYDIIEKLSASYNNLCQAEKSKIVPVTKFTKDGIFSSYSEPISAAGFESVDECSIHSIPAIKTRCKQCQ